ncbi:MAG: hypothetical protein ACI9U2_003247 [Bradymonadia bacterium]
MIWIALAVGVAVVVLFVTQRGSQGASNVDPDSPIGEHSMTLSVATPTGDDSGIGPLPAPTKPKLPAGMYTFGFIWRWEDGAWHLDTPPDCEPITRIFGVDGALWATGWKELWQHTAQGWVRHDMPVRLFAMHGWSADDFLVGGIRSLYRLEDGAFVAETMLPESVSAIWGLTPDDVFAVGWSGMIMHARDGAWTREASGESERLTGVWGDADTVVAVGDAGIALHSRGDGQWARDEVPTDDDGRALSFAGVWGDGAGTWYAITGGGAILARRGGKWAVEHRVGRQLLGIQGCAKTGEVLASGLQGQLWRSLGDGTWSDLSGSRANSLNTAHRDDDGERLWVGGDWFFEIASQKPGIEAG